MVLELWQKCFSLLSISNKLLKIRQLLCSVYCNADALLRSLVIKNRICIMVRRKNDHYHCQNLNITTEEFDAPFIASSFGVILGSLYSAIRHYIANCQYFVDQNVSV